MLDFDTSDSLKLKMEKLRSKDRNRADIIKKKIKEIISSDIETIMRYKNLRNEMKDCKRVHIDKHFVLTFKVDVGARKVLFVDFDHHDKIYGR